MIINNAFSRAAVAALMLGVSGVAGAETIAITGGKVFPVSGPAIENGTVVITDGKITAVGANVPVPAGAKTIDAKGKWVTPGLINAATTLGVVEIGAVPDANDARSKGQHAVSAAFRVWEGLNPASVYFAPARNEGVTNTALLPGGGLIAGQAAFLETFEGEASDMIRRSPVAMVASLASAEAAESRSRGEMFLRLRELLEDARAYGARKVAFEAGNTREFAVGRLHLDALQQVLAGKIPLVVNVDRASDIESALAIAQEYKLRIAILGGAEAWKVGAKLAAAKVPVMTTALDSIPTSFATLGQRQENAGLLRQAGVSVAVIAGENESFNVRNVRQHAGNAVAYGMTWDDALRAVTLTPAEIYGMEGTLGSLQVGRDGNVVVWDGDPFEYATRATTVLVRGREAQGKSRQDMLIERYKAKTGQ